MTDSSINRTIDITSAFIDGIRTVVIVDDRMRSYEQVVRNAGMGTPLAGPMTAAVHEEEPFPSAVPKSSAQKTEDAAAGALIEDFRKRGWLHDIINDDFDTQAIERAKKCDLVILDYMLGDNSNSSIKILGELAHSPRLHLVILYTREEETDVWFNIGMMLGGPPPNMPDLAEEEEDALSDFMSTNGPPTRQEIMNCLCKDRQSTTRPAIAPASASPRERLKDLQVLREALREHNGRQRDRGALGLSLVSRLETSSRDLKWLRCDNLFVVIQHKNVKTDDTSDSSAASAPRQALGGEALIARLISSLEEWRPSFMRRMLRFLRHRIAEPGLIADADILRGPLGEAALLLYAHEGTPEEQVERRRRVYARVLDGALIGLFQGGDLLDRVDNFPQGADALTYAAEAVGLDAEQNREEIYFRLNWFLAFEERLPPYLRTGTIFELPEDKNLVGICVTPECDLVPGRKKPGTNSVQAVQWRKATLNRDNDARWSKFLKQNLEKAEKNHHLFLRMENENCIINLRPNSSDSIPTPETFFTLKGGKIDKDQFFEATRVLSDADGNPRLEGSPKKFRVLGQLREAYATKLLHEAGHQLSRVGVDFVSLRRP